MSIPESKIRINTNLDISTLPLSNDVIDHITEYCTSYIEPSVSKDLFWFSLGNETGRLRRWATYCWQIVGNSYGKASLWTKHFHKMVKFGDVLQYELDILICAAYPMNVHTIDTYDGPVSITSVFYKYDDIEPYPVRYIGKVRRNHTFRNSISISEKRYIVAFIKRLDEYINYIERTLTVSAAGLKRKPDIKFKTFRTIYSNLKTAVDEMDVDIVNE